MSSYKLAKILCTSFGLGYISKFPGTLASFITIVFVYLIITLVGSGVFFVAFVIYFVSSFFLIRNFIKKKRNKDPKEVVIDEHVGQCIPLIYCESSFDQFLLAFILFRFFDILKPFPVSYFDNIKNEYGVLLDDVTAGLLTLISFILFDALFNS
ncbi:MAG: phosphatidylglycerophosphatase [Rickettsiales bacterium]|nr:phosphatidylglycerophosphatase [Rickettsiales bacterium]